MTWKSVNNLFISFIIGIIVGYTCHDEKASVVPPNEEEFTRDSIIRDSIYIINDSIRTEIIYLEQKYDKETTAIMSNSDSLNLVFFTEYLNDYIGTIENRESNICGTQKVLGTDSVAKSTNN